jgi:hypothetical protein
VRALIAALTGLLGEEDSARVRDVHLDCGEATAHCLDQHFDELRLTDPDQ